MKDEKYAKTKLAFIFITIILTDIIAKSYKETNILHKKLYIDLCTHTNARKNLQLKTENSNSVNSQKSLP